MRYVVQNQGMYLPMCDEAAVEEFLSMLPDEIKVQARVAPAEEPLMFVPAMAFLAKAHGSTLADFNASGLFRPAYSRTGKTSFGNPFKRVGFENDLWGIEFRTYVTPDGCVHTNMPLTQLRTADKYFPYVYHNINSNTDEGETMPVNMSIDTFACGDLGFEEHSKFMAAVAKARELAYVLKYEFLDVIMSNFNAEGFKTLGLYPLEEDIPEGDDDGD